MTFFTSNSLVVFFALSVLSWIQTVSGQSPVQCSLCGADPSVLPVSDRWDRSPPSTAQTCYDLYIQLSTVLTNNDVCTNGRDVGQNFCCNPDFDPDSPPAANDGSTNAVDTPSSPPPAPTSPPYEGPVGTEPDCPICGTMEYPGKPYEFIVARYVGEFTCDQLYGRGLHGMIPSFMCGPLQDFAQSECGCGSYNPDCISNPQNCYGNPGNPTIPAPTPSPVAPTGDNSLTAAPAAATTSQANANPGTRSLLRGARAQEESDSSVPPPPSERVLSAEDLHFETR